MTLFLRLLGVGALCAFMIWAWVAGERRLRRAIEEDRPPLRTFAGMWRLLMVVASVVLLIAVIGLWRMQDVATNAEATAVQAREAAALATRGNVALCRESREWQEAALGIREADVRIAQSELDDANAELEDTQEAIADAEAAGIGEGSFVREFFARELDRAMTRRDALQVELDRRDGTFKALSNQVLEECPPEATLGD